MGNGASREANAAAAGSASAAAAAAGGTGSGSGGGSSQPECPVPAEFRQQVYKNPAVYNVYNQRINDQAPASSSSPLAGLPGQDVLDPKNNMPLEPNQQPCPGQTKLLSTDRQPSNIPKGGTHSTWTYPSPQMFFNGEPAAEAGSPAGSVVCSVCRVQTLRARRAGMQTAPSEAGTL
jgi:cytochrome c heme-lyase